MKALLEKLLDGVDLDVEQAYRLLEHLTDNQVEAAWKGAALAALRVKGETAVELRGMALAMRDHAIPVPTEPSWRVVDTCGTGGDGSGSFNVSTAASLVAAAAGVHVAKHGNRSVSSRCGSADVLEALGIPLLGGASAARASLEQHRFAFLFAPGFHPAMKAVVPVRRAMGVRTAFNLLGPLTNPARPSFQLLGAFSEDAARLMAEALSGMPVDRAFVVHGAPSWDEATPVGPFVCFEVRDGAVERRVVDPQERYGLPRCREEDLAGGDTATNVALMRALFAGAGRRGDGPPDPVSSAIRDAVVLNVALVLELVGVAGSPEAAIGAAEAAIDDGRAERLLDRLAR